MFLPQFSLPTQSYTPQGPSSGSAGSNSFQVMMQQMMTMMAMLMQMSGAFGSSGSMLPMMPGFGGNGDYGVGTGNGMSDFLGNGGSYGTSPTGETGSSQATTGPIPAGTDFGSRLAADAARNANGPGGYCYRWVKRALKRAGVDVNGASAYMAADRLARSPQFQEIQVNPKDLGQLPAGAVVVWGRGAGHPHGHISISMGDGREASDKIRKQITGYGTRVRVFVPRQG